MMYAGYMEGGKPVTKRYGIESVEPKKQSQKTEEKPTVSLPRKSEVKQEKQRETVPAKTVAEKAIQEKSNVPEPPPKTSESKAIVLAKSMDLVRQKAPPKSVVASEKQSPVVPKERIVERDKNAFLVSGFGGVATTTCDGGDAMMCGVILEYRRTLADTRCDDCDLGNRLILSLKIGYGGGEDSDDSGNYSWEWDGSYKCDEITQVFATGGLIWQHQLSRNVSVMLGGFAGVCQTEAEISGTAYRYYYDYYYGYGYSYYDEYSESDSVVSFCYGASLGIAVEFGKHHSLEISAEILGGKADLNLPDWEENQVTGFLRFSYGYHF